MKAIRLRTEHMHNPIGIDASHPMLSWCCEDGIRQTAFQIIARKDGETVWDSGIRKTDRMYCRYDATPRSRDRITWQVRLWDETDRIGPWSDEAAFELGITDVSEWEAAWIDPETQKQDISCDDAINRKAKTAWDQEKQKEPFSPHLPASYLRKVFTADPGRKNRLYITCKGVYKAYLNGEAVGDYVLAPGPAVYPQYIPVQAYDLNPLIKAGENELLVILGDGWCQRRSESLR